MQSNRRRINRVFTCQADVRIDSLVPSGQKEYSLPLSKPELQDIRSLLTGKGRNRRQEFLAEGIRLMEEALRHRYRPTSLYFSQSLLSERGEKLVEAYRRARVEMHEIPARQLEAISDTKAPQGVVGRFGTPQSTLEQLYRPETRKLLLCENIGDPGNLGTLIRSALAFEMELVITIGTSAELYSPKVVRSSAGAVFGIGMVHTTWSEVKRLRKSLGTALVAADLSASEPVERLRSLAEDRGVMLAVGSESTGLSEELMAQADVRVRIKHSRSVESLNAAVAGSLLMRELYQESSP